VAAEAAPLPFFRLPIQGIPARDDVVSVDAPSSEA
jgi:hypothetical protein